MPTTPTPATRAFNGLNGAEIRKRILHELEQRLIQDTRLAAHLVFPLVTWTWTLELETYPPSGALGPQGEGVLRTEVRGRVSVSNEDAETPAPPPRESALLDARGPRSALQERADRANAPFRGDADRGLADRSPASAALAATSLPAAVETRFERLEAMMQQLLAGAGAPAAGSWQQPIPIGPAIPVNTGVATTQVTETLPPPSYHPDVPMHTGTGLPIRGGARPSPGAGLAEPFGGGAPVGVVQTPEAVKVAFGVRHPPIDEGGVGAPDAVRRETGLPIPQMTSTAGGVVDLPAGSF